MSDTLFPLDPIMPPTKAKSSRSDTWSRLAAQRLAKMHKAHGYGPPDTPCKNCVHLRRHQQGKTWMKCSKARMSSSEATDWRAGWPSCGLYEETK